MSTRSPKVSTAASRAHGLAVRLALCCWDNRAAADLDVAPNLLSPKACHNVHGADSKIAGCCVVSGRATSRDGPCVVHGASGRNVAAVLACCKARAPRRVLAQ